MSQTFFRQHPGPERPMALDGQPLPLFIKYLDCIFAAIAIVDFYNSLVLYPALFTPAISRYLFLFHYFNLLLVVAALLFLVIFPVHWHRIEARGLQNSGLRHAWLTGIIRYWIAVEIFNYGFAKILGTQFAPSYFKNDSTWSSLSGLDLTWNYFSYSYAMAVIIAGIQIVGSAFLLFRRTTILGIILLLPVMVNIVLIDIFYSIPYGALANAILFTLGLSYLLLLQWPAIKAFFVQSLPILPVIRLGGIKNVLRISLAAYAFAFIYYVTTTSAPGSLTGKWRVDQLVRHGDTAKVNDWLTDSMSWKNIYLEEYGRAVFNPNPYVVETGRAMAGTYLYERDKRTIKFELSSHTSAANTLYADVTMLTPGHMKWKLIRQKDTAFLLLTKIPVDIHR
ncbi:hypothetical protein [Chitinophaga tropicalis]|uniref:DoxX family protein n=1 Tax=Chitinophaga tropicalis TaxID=2683588 RepID=A0A7K1UCR3_9BACT|nr:hypothetical protein [Chitinophaga tropicalis]MVT12106.1 hypothetical protein [Chitinophaga tropicalis]